MRSEPISKRAHNNHSFSTKSAFTVLEQNFPPFLEEFNLYSRLSYGQSPRTKCTFTASKTALVLEKEAPWSCQGRGNKIPFKMYNLSKATSTKSHLLSTNRCTTVPGHREDQVRRDTTPLTAAYRRLFHMPILKPFMDKRHKHNCILKKKEQGIWLLVSCLARGENRHA